MPKENFKTKTSLTVDEALVKVMNYCVYQDRCHQEVEKKLDELEMYEEAKAYIITKLIEEDFLNEERFARSYARGKFRIKKYGRLRITRELKAKNISAYNLKAGLSEIDEDDYLKTLKDLSEQKLKTLNEPNAYKKRQKLYQHLAYKGYETELIYDVINDLLPM
ncbi:RecX family transcriptional regulator [Psychroflexus sp. CAK57W]|uniref:regulatory protein RecX n=1 Tax=Psychroflexus curvus TaxID=2873595 RepID=UPI001CCDFF4D|nr:regulatory protein RecX [Psychroflexus curvus]MBZ9626958.1 RecX family transcriptional regulator [Psychroflexus curvus]MBZ9786951.1 RecX family transcriptional regulator [Psychroflexus curvus]